MLIDAGYRDSYREVNPFVDRAADRTWSPRFPDHEQERIDFMIVAPSAVWKLHRTTVIDQPLASDHRPVLADITIQNDRP